MINNRLNISQILLVVGLLLLIVLPLDAQAQSEEKVQRDRNVPLYIVNGKRMDYTEARDISPRNILSEKLLPADEQTIAKYGNEASNGVVLITLRYDTPARFEIDGKEQRYSRYIAERIKWGESDPIARVIIAFRVNADGTVSEREVLEASDKRLLRRIQKMMAEAPKWIPAQRDGKGVTTDHVLRITLPQGRQLPPEPVLIIR
ncbi:MAG: TonB-dependent receptor [Rikenellaceae bacterium]|nr:TonB-dependent receptor [Rikenellaceae bacterium]